MHDPAGQPPRVYRDTEARLYYSPNCPFSLRFIETFEMPPHWQLINLDYRQSDGRGNEIVYIPSINDYHPLPIFVNGSPILHLPQNGSDNSLRGVRHIQEAFPQYFNEHNFRKTSLHPTAKPPAAAAATTKSAPHLYQPEGTRQSTRNTGKLTEEESQQQYEKYMSEQQELWSHQSRLQQGHSMIVPTNNSVSSSISGSYDDLQQPSRSRTRGIALSGFR